MSQVTFTKDDLKELNALIRKDDLKELNALIREERLMASLEIQEALNKPPVEPPSEERTYREPIRCGFCSREHPAGTPITVYFPGYGRKVFGCKGGCQP